VIPILTQTIYSEMDSSFIGASIISIIFGVLFFLSNLNHDKRLILQQAFLLTALSWLSFATFGSLPFIFSSLELSLTYFCTYTYFSFVDHPTEYRFQVALSTNEVLFY